MQIYDSPDILADKLLPQFLNKILSKKAWLIPLFYSNLMTISLPGIGKDTS